MVIPTQPVWVPLPGGAAWRTVERPVDPTVVPVDGRTAMSVAVLRELVEAGVLTVDAAALGRWVEAAGPAPGVGLVVAALAAG